ncbi:MAG: polyhydroxyalkanoate synthesis repressor PhaR [Steroidobacteraceae bacterium]
MTEERVIKKYANRRLYDATASRHVTLDDLRKLIVSGAKIKVVEDKSGEDITRSILLQIIADQEQFGQPILSTPTLETIIRFYGDTMQGFMGRYLEQSVATFMQQQQAMQSQLSKLMPHTPLSPFGDLMQQNLAMWQQMQESWLATLRAAQAANRQARAPSAEPATTTEHGRPTPSPVADRPRALDPHCGSPPRMPPRVRRPPNIGTSRGFGGNCRWPSCNAVRCSPYPRNE